MHGIIALGFFAGLVSGVILSCMPSRTDAASTDVSWTAPTTNADGTPLRDLAGYRLYVDTHPPTCPGGDFLDVPSSRAEPAEGEQVSQPLTGLDDNTTYFARVTAVDQSGNESECSETASGVPHPDLGVTSATASGDAASSSMTLPPPTSTGSLKVGITAPTAGATVSGLAWVVLWVEGTSGSANAFTLSANGRVVGSQTTSARGPVTIPWTPEANGTNTLTASVRDAAGNIGTTTMPVNVVGASGGVVTMAAPPPPPPPAVNDTLQVFITQPVEGAIVAGTAWIVLWVDGTTGSNNTFTLSVDGGVVGSETTGARGPVVIPWQTSVANGSHTLTATVRDAAGNTGRTSFPVIVRN